jgi:acyl-CoA synthetase (AMP-forming)/AMP-acid ligase II
MIEIPQRLLGEALIISARKNTNKTAVIVKNREYSYYDLKTEAEKMARHLLFAGIKRGDRVAVYMNNSWQSIVSIYGITLSGAVFLVINPQTKAGKLHYILKDSGARILITESLQKNELISTLDDSSDIEEVIITGDISAISGLTKVASVDFEEVLLTGANTSTILPKAIPNDLAALIYTSGSTGFPKGVMMTHQSMVFTSWSLIEYLRLSEGDRILLLLPLAFDYGLYQLLMAITMGGSLIVEQSFTFQTSVYKQIEMFKPTVFPGVPTIYAMMIAANKKTGLSFDCIKKVTNTAAALPAEFIPDLKKIFPKALIFKMYGLTECKRVCYLEPELIDIKTGSVGKAIPGTEVFLLSPEGNPVAAGERGILHIRGPHVMLGYWHKEELSREMLRQGNLPGERILCSNDWFKMDEEGFLYFLGRTDDIIKTRGEKVSPSEIENIIYKIKGIKEVAVVGIPDAILGEAIVALVTTYSNSLITEKEILKECTSKLELFMVPQKVIFLDEMPKSSNSKIDKKELKKMYSKNE